VAQRDVVHRRHIFVVFFLCSLTGSLVPNVQLFNGDVLTEDGKVAINPACCCGVTGCRGCLAGGLPDNIQVSFSGVTTDNCITGDCLNLNDTFTLELIGDTSNCVWQTTIENVLECENFCFPPSSCRGDFRISVQMSGGAPSCSLRVNAITLVLVSPPTEATCCNHQFDDGPRSLYSPPTLYFPSYTSTTCGSALCRGIGGVGQWCDFSAATCEVDFTDPEA
jgi:hypothetical protein